MRRFLLVLALSGCGDDSGATADGPPGGGDASPGSDASPGGDGACPAAGTEAGQGCVTVDDRDCSGGGGEVLECQDVSGCLTWVSFDNCADDGLLCGGAISPIAVCVCPANTTTDFYANPVVDRTARSLYPTGVRTPAICSFATMHEALAAATMAGEVGPTRTRAVASADDPPPGWDGVARFDDDMFPWVIFSYVSVTTVEDPEVGGSGDYEPSRWIAEVTNHNSTLHSASIRVGMGSGPPMDPILRGFTIVEGSCTDAGGSPVSCGLPLNAIEVQGFGGDTARLEHVTVSGAGGRRVVQGTGGTITANADGTATFTATMVDPFGGLLAADNYALELRGPGSDNNGFYFVRAFGGDLDSVTFYAPGALSETFTGSFTLRQIGDWDVGVYVYANAILDRVQVSDFGSDLGVRSRVGLVSELEGNAARVVGGRFISNDYGVRISQGSAIIDPVGSVPTSIEASLLYGLFVAGGNVLATDILIEGSGSDGILVQTGSLELDGGRIVENVLRGVQVAGSLSANGTTIADNGADGVEVVMVPLTATTSLVNCDIHGNGGIGVEVLRARHAGDSLGAPVDIDTYDEFSVAGFSASGGTQIHDNTGDGLVIGYDVQSASIFADVADVLIFGNGGVGVRVMQNNGKGPLGTAGDCAPTDGCTALQLRRTDVSDNRRGGVVLMTSFLKAFESNVVRHNAFPDATCTGQTAPQILVEGPVGFRTGVCGAATSQAECDAENDPATSANGANNHCLWNGVTCDVAWELSGTDPLCETPMPNAVYAYEGVAPDDVGLAARLGAKVLALRNRWRFVSPAQNVSVDASSFIDVRTDCGTRALCP